MYQWCIIGIHVPVVYVYVYDWLPKLLVTEILLPWSDDAIFTYMF